MTNVLGRVGARLRQLRVERRLTQEKLAEASGLSYKFIGEVERGVGNASLTTLDALARALSVDVSEFLRDDAAPRRATARDLVAAREALSALEAFIERAALRADVRYKARRRKKP